MVRRLAGAAALLAAACLAARGDDSLLARITAHTLRELARLPDCTCLETLLREHKQPAEKGEMRPLDTVRLEVLYSRNHELYASPGDEHWEENPAAFPAAGLVGTGPFALYLRAIFGSGDAAFTESASTALPAPPAVRYDFRIPRSARVHHMQVPGGEGFVGIKGSFWADPVSLDLLRLETESDEIPPELPVVFFTAAVTYARVQIGGRDVVLPQSGEMHMLNSSGQEDRDRIEFTHCRSFHTESSVSFDLSPPAPAAPLPAFSSIVLAHPKQEQTLPAGLEITIALAGPLNQHSLVGSAIEGRVTHDVRTRDGVLIPRNAVAHGRIRRMDPYSDRSGNYFIVALEFIEIETSNSLVRFFADLMDVQHLPGLDFRWSTSQRSSVFDGRKRIVTTQQSFLPNLPGVGAFFLRATQFTLPAGMEFFWKTRELEPARR
jgi:hypothetical protein